MKGYEDCDVCHGKGSYTKNEFDGYDRWYDNKYKCWPCHVRFLEENNQGFAVKLTNTTYQIVERQQGKYVMYNSYNGDIHWTNLTFTEEQLHEFAWKALQ